MQKNNKKVFYQGYDKKIYSTAFFKVLVTWQIVWDSLDGQKLFINTVFTFLLSITTTDKAVWLFLQETSNWDFKVKTLFVYRT